MNELKLTRVPVMKTGMLIRRPAADVYRAFVDPAITTRFWFTRSSGPLETGKVVLWEWERYGVSARVDVKSLEPDERIAVEWPGQNGLTTVEWRLKPIDDGATFVSVTESGFTGTGDEIVQQVTDSTQGFTIVLAGLKALLEHGIELNLVPDRYPEGFEAH